MKHLELALRLYCSLVESAQPVNARTLWSWDSVRKAIAHDQDLLIDVGRLDEANRDRVLRYTGEFAPMESLGKVYVFPDAGSARGFVNEVEAAGQVAEMYGDTIVHAHADYMSEVAMAAVNHGGVPYEGPSLGECSDWIDTDLPFDMVQDGIRTDTIREALLRAYRKPLRTLKESVVAIHSGDHTSKFAGRLDNFWAPKDVMGYPAYVVEGLVRSGALTEAQATTLYEQDPNTQEKPPTMGQTPDRGGAAELEPDQTGGNAAQSQSEPQQDPDKPTEYRPAEEEGAPTGDITMPDGTPIPQEILKTAFAQFLGQLKTQVENGTEGGEASTKADAEQPAEENPPGDQTGADTTTQANQEQSQPPAPPQGTPNGQPQVKAAVPESINEGEAEYQFYRGIENVRSAISYRKQASYKGTLSKLVFEYQYRGPGLSRQLKSYIDTVVEALEDDREYEAADEARKLYDLAKLADARYESKPPYIPATLPRGLLHGSRPLQEGTPVRVVGTRGDRLVCETTDGSQILAPPNRVVALAESYDLDAALVDMAAGHPPTTVARRRLRANLGEKFASTSQAAQRLTEGAFHRHVRRVSSLESRAAMEEARARPIPGDIRDPRHWARAWAEAQRMGIHLYAHDLLNRHTTRIVDVGPGARTITFEGMGRPNRVTWEQMETHWDRLGRDPNKDLRLELFAPLGLWPESMQEAAPADTTGSFISQVDRDDHKPASADDSTVAVPKITAQQWAGEAAQHQEESNPSNHTPITKPTNAGGGHHIDRLKQNDGVRKMSNVAEGLGGYYDGDAGNGTHVFVVPTDQRELFVEAANYNELVLVEAGIRGSYVTYELAESDPTVDEALDGLESAGNKLLEQLDTGQEAEAEAAAKAFASAADEIKKLRQATFNLTTDQLVRLTSILQAIGNKPAAGKVEKVRNALAGLQDAAKKASDELQKAHDQSGVGGAEEVQDPTNGQNGENGAPPAEEPPAEAPPNGQNVDVPPAPAPDQAAQQAPPQESYLKDPPNAVLAEQSTALLRARWKNPRRGPFREGQIVWVAPFDESQGEVWVAEDPHSRRGVYAARESVEILERQDPKMAVMETAILRVIDSDVPECIAEGEVFADVRPMIRGICHDLPLTSRDVADVFRVVEHFVPGRQTVSVSSAVLAELGQVDDPLIGQLVMNLQDGAPVVPNPLLLEVARVVRQAGNDSLASTLEESAGV